MLGDEYIGVIVIFFIFCVIKIKGKEKKKNRLGAKIRCDGRNEDWKVTR